MATRVSEFRNGSAGQADVDLRDDRSLVLDFQNGSPNAYPEIYRRYEPLARSVCRRILASADDAEEASQETMLRVLQGLGRFNGRYAMQPWVARIATNVSLDRVRAATRRPQPAFGYHDLSEDFRSGEDEPGEAFERLIEQEQVREVLDALPAHHRGALVLREFEGRSHREIAEELGITSAQAKALIHRAKSTFRRRWLESLGERGGLTGIALVPLLWLIRLGGAGRRIAERVVHAAGTSEIVTSAATTTAAPAASATAERIVTAAAVTVLLAGGVTVGAAITHRSHDREARAAATPVVHTVPPPAPVVAPPIVPDPREKGSNGGRSLAAVDPTPAAAPAVSVTPDPSATPDPSDSPGTDPSGSPSAPPPVIPPPAWAGAFGVNWASDDLCGCGPGVSIESTETTGSLSADTALVVSQSFSGAALDAEGDAAWLVRAQVRASLTTKGGAFEMSFALGRDGVETAFAATGTVTAVSGDLTAGEPVTFYVWGTYGSIGADQDSPIRTSGSFRAVLSVWSDSSSVYGLEIALAP